MKTKISLIFIAFSLLISACEKDGELKNGGGRDIAYSENCELEINSDGIYITPLIAGQNMEVGTVYVQLTADNIIVTYESSGWLITETHLHIAKNEDLLFAQITNRAGNPRIGNFAYGEDNNINKTKVSYIISKEDIGPEYLENWDNCYVIAAHAVVKGLGVGGNVYENLDAFATILPGTATVAIDHPASNENSYFNVKVSDAGILDGTWPGWCIETDAEIVPGPPPSYETEVFSSYEDVPGYESEVLIKINWILNQKFVFNDYTYGDVQIAMWTLLHGYEIFNDDARAELGATTPNPFEISVIGPWTPEKVNEILNQVKDVTEFIPECGGVIAIVFVHNGQDLIIEYPFPCYGDETAWGQGCLFKGNSWAMYFKVCF